MALSCECGDFYKGDHDKWWEIGRKRTPPKGSRCCECNAPLPDDEKAACIVNYEVWDGPVDRPMEPWVAEKDASISDEEYQAIEDVWYKWERENGWDSEDERFERIAHIDYRCDRCAGLAEAYEDLGYCLIEPGLVIEANIEYALEHSGVHLKWIKDNDGVYQPRHWSRFDHIKHGIRNIKSKIYYYWFWRKYEYRRKLAWFKDKVLRGMTWTKK